MKLPRITVLMPVYDGQKYLKPAIESILNQTYKDFEFLVIDDGSKDKSLEIINSYAKKDPRIRVISRPNKGLVATLDEGLAEARGEYIARMDADDISLPQRLEKQMRYLGDNSDYVVVGSSFTSIYDHNRVGGVHHCFINDLTIRHALPIEGCIPHPTALFKKKAVLMVGGYRKNYPHAEDYDLWRRLAEVGKLANLPEPLLNYRHRSSSVSYANLKEQATATNRIKDEIWRDKKMSAYKKIPLAELRSLPGEYIPALKKLRRQLLVRSLKYRELGLALYYLKDIVRDGL